MQNHLRLLEEWRDSNMYTLYIKRLMDIIVSLLGIIFFTPIYLIVSCAVLISMGSPVIFKQERVGLNEKLFIMYKFRSMRISKNDEGNIADDHNRLTRVGLFLRSTSLDELPELFNVLKGDMSLVGPRPFPSYYLPYYSSVERNRHRVRGGLIPCDGILGKIDDTWEEQFAAELQYVQNVSFWLDVKIIIITFKLLFKRAFSNYGRADRPLLNEVRNK